jgi:thioredoxin-like negative regulator of GroEL
LNSADASDGKQEEVINAVTQAAASDDFRAALIEIAKNGNDSRTRRKAIKCLSQVAENHDEALKALIDIAKHDRSKTNPVARDWARYRNTPIVATVAIGGLADLAPKYGDALAALIDIAKNDENESDRWKAMACLAELAPQHDDARQVLNEIALDENDPLRDFAADALESLATIDPSDGQSPPFDPRGSR